MTGGSGFVGSALISRLCQCDDVQVVALVRGSLSHMFTNVEPIPVRSIDSDLPALPLLGIDTVIHCAARVHQMGDSSLSEYRRVNVGGTLALARQAAAAGVRRFIFISSIKVNGESTVLGSPFSAADIPAPVDPYGISKYEAEQGLFELSDNTGMEVVVIRPVLVYGPGVKANFSTMMRWLYKSIPLPLGAIDNRRSLIALNNLVDLIVTCIDHPNAAKQVFLASDGNDLSTSQLLTKLATALERPLRLFAVPAWLLFAAATVVGKKPMADRLFDSLQVDIQKTREYLDWHPPLSLDDALAQTASYFIENEI